MFRAWELLEYEPTLWQRIFRGEFLPAHGPEEVAIRAGAIQVGRLFWERAGVPPRITDLFACAQRKFNPEPYHPTVTTDY